MHVKINTEELAEALAKSRPAAADLGSHTLEAFKLLKIHAKADGINITTATPEIAVRQSLLQSEVVQEGTSFIPRQKLAEITREAGETIEIREEKKHLLVAAGGATFKFPKPSDELPEPAAQEKGEAIELRGRVLRELIEAALPFTSRDATRVALTAVLIDTSAKETSAVATDGHRLVVAKADSQGTKNQAILIPPEAAKTAANLAGDEETVTIKDGENAIRIEGDNYAIQAIKLNSEYPNYRQVIPKDAKHSLSVKREELAGAIARMRILSDRGDRHRGVKFLAKESTLRLEVSNPDLGEGEEEIKARITGEPPAVALNASYLLDALSVMKKEDEEVVIEINQEITPVVVHGVSKNPLIVIMPMRL